MKALTPHSIDAVPAELAGGVVAVGNFDGVHAGHRALLEIARAEAGRRHLRASVLTFEPHPRSFFRPGDPVFRLTPLPAKARLLAALGLDGLIVADFDRAFASHTADAFIDEMLVRRLNVAGIVVGFDFRFGQGRAGTSELLAAAGRQRGFAVTIVDQVCAIDGAPVSSSAIRAALAEGNVAAANALLGYTWFIVGKVVPGERRGRELGFPTANIRLADDCRLRHGIYAVRLRRADGAMVDGVASYGRRPTFDNGAPLLEVYLFDFAADLYGEEVSVTFVQWIRPELKFDSLDALVAAIQGDVAAARGIFSATGDGSAIDRALAAVG